MDIRDSVYSLCGMCGNRCPIEVSRINGKPVWLSGNPYTPTGGALCPRGAAGMALWQDFERPHGPLLRTGPRGAGSWQECTWDEALDHVAQKLRDIVQQHGASSVLWSERPGPCTDLNKAFLHALGSPNYCTHAVSCSHNVDQAAFSVSGYEQTNFVYDYAHCRHVVFQGRNVFEALSMGEVNAVLDAMEGDCTVTAIDVRATITACKAHNFLMVRPGTDYALNLAIIHTLLHEQLFNATYARQYIDDLDALQAFIQPYTAAWAAQECDLDAARIITLARDIAAVAPAVIWHPGWMRSRYYQSFMTSRSAYIINALLGSIGQRGGLIIASTPRSVGRQACNSFSSLYPQPAGSRADGVGCAYTQFSPQASFLHKAFKAMRTAVPNPLRAYIAFNHDPLTSLPDAENQKQCFEALELLVSIGYSWSDTAWHADVVLPMSTYLERDSLLLTKNGLTPQIHMRKAACPPRYDTLADWEIISRLSARMGFDKLAFTSITDIWQAQLQGTGINIEDFATTGFVTLTDSPHYPPLHDFPTPSGKLEMRSRTWTQAGVDSLAPYVPCAHPYGKKLRLVVGRVALHTQSHTQNNPLLAAEMPENVAWLHSSRAQEWGIQQGERVRVTASDGHSGIVRVFCTDGIHPEALFLVHGFGHTLPVELQAKGQGLADQTLMPHGLAKEDPLGYALALQEQFVTVDKIQRDKS